MSAMNGDKANFHRRCRQEIQCQVLQREKFRSQPKQSSAAAPKEKSA